MAETIVVCRARPDRARDSVNPILTVMELRVRIQACELHARRYMFVELTLP
jgi:hypothetical protein